MITSSPLISPVTTSAKQSKSFVGSSNEAEGSFASTFQKAVHEEQPEAKSTAASALSENTQSNQPESQPAEENEQTTALDAEADNDANEKTSTPSTEASEDAKDASEKDVVIGGEEVSGGNIEQVNRQDLAGGSLSKEKNLENIDPAAELEQASNEEVLNVKEQTVVDNDRVEQTELTNRIDENTQSDLDVSEQSKSVDNEVGAEEVKDASLSLDTAEESDKPSLPLSENIDEQITESESEHMITAKVESIGSSSEHPEPGQLNDSDKSLPKEESASLNTQQKVDASVRANTIANDESFIIREEGVEQKGQARGIEGQYGNSVVVEGDIDSDGTAVQKDALIANVVSGSNVYTSAKESDVSTSQSVLSSNAISRDSTPSGLERATENLRLMMEQVTKQGATNTNTNVPLSQTLSTDAKLESGPLAQFEGDLIQVDAEDGLISKNIDNLLADKKSFEQIMSNLGSVSQQGQLNSSLFSTVASTTAARNDSLAAQLTMQSMPDAQAFPSEMATKVAWVAKEGFKVAHIQLDPPELGSLAVKVSVDQDSNTHVSFVASSAQAKDALEGQMQRLREMLQQQGLELDSVDVEVSQGNNGQAFGSNNSEHSSSGSQSESGNLSDVDGLDEDLDNVSYVSPVEQGIDYYA